MSNKKNVVYLGCSGFPYGYAEMQKILLISRCLVLTGNNVTVIGTRGVHRKKEHPDLEASGSYENIKYVYTTGDPFRNESFIKRNLSKITGRVNEFLLLRKRKKNKELDYAILSTHNSYLIFYYVILSKLFGFKTILNYVEFYSGVEKNFSQAGLWLNDKLFDRYAPVVVDGIFPISEFIINHLKKVAPNKKYLKIPGLTNYERFKDIETIEGEKYFLYCGAASYKEVVLFIIDAFNLLNTPSTFLYLVINGTEANISEIKNYINSTPQKDKIKMFSKLSDKQLNTYYKNAIALLIPLRPTYQDIARFPHKIGEYFASGNPIISTNYGEVKYYFKDMEAMLIADSYDLNLYAEKMQFVIDNPEAAKKIGITGNNLAAPIFDHRIKAMDINNFLDTEL